MHEESVRRYEARIRRQLHLGRGKHTHHPYYAEPDDYLATHMHLIGASRFGKSYYLEHHLRAYTDLRIPASIIDPHGDHAKHYYEFLCRSPRLRRDAKFIHFKPGDEANGIGFNPFACGLSDPAEVASLVLEAFMKVWGEKTFNETPRLERVLRLMFHVFAENALPLTESYQFLLVANRPWRQDLLARVADEKVRASWEEIEKLPRSDMLERFESSWNRLQRFLAVPAVSNLFNGDKPSLNFTEILDRGDILVADLSGLHSTEAQSLVGTMMVNSLYHAAKRRPESKRRPWVLALDEFPQLLTTDIARSLDQLLKFGIRLILAHQHLAQLPEELRASLMTNAKIKVVFGGLSRPDAEALAHELFTGEVCGDRVKHITYATKFRPILTQREVETHSESTSEGESEGSGWSEGTSRARGETQGSTEGESTSVRQHDEETDETITHALSTNRATSTSDGESSGRSGSRSSSRSQIHGHSVSTAYVTEYEEFKEAGAPQFWPLNEQWEALIAGIMRLERREALIKVFNHPVLDIVTPEIRHTRLRRRKRKALPEASNGGRPPMKPPKSGPAAAQDNLPEDFRE